MSAVGLEGAERVGLPTIPIQREHELVPRPFAQRELDGQALELADCFGLAAEQQRLGSILARAEAKLLESSGVSPDPRFGRELVVRGPVPQGERFVESHLRLGRVARCKPRMRCGQQPLEARGIDHVGVDDE